jgi:hypothetical protein
LIVDKAYVIRDPPLLRYGAGGRVSGNPVVPPGLLRFAAPVDRARAVQAIGSTLELVHEAIMLKDLFHGDGRFDGPEVNEL